MRTIATLFACAIVAITGFAAQKNISNLRTISVSGTALLRTSPDVIVWTLGVSESDKDLVAAKRRNDQRVKALLVLRKELDLHEGDLETGDVSIRREYEQDQQGHQGEFKHYTMSRTILVRERDLEQFDRFLERFVASAKPDVYFEFQSTRLEGLRAEARLKALAAAREKAAALAKVLGAKLGKVLKVDEHLPVYAAGGGGGGGGLSNFTMMDPGFQPDSSGGTFFPGPMDVRVTVYAAFELQ